MSKNPGVITPRNCDPSVRQAIQQLSAKVIGLESTPSFAALTLSGLTDTHILYSDSSTITGDGTFTFNSTTKAVSIRGVGDGDLTSYDLKVGTTGTPTYGMIQMGNSVIGRTSYNVGDVDLDGAILVRNIAGPVTGEIEFIWTEAAGDSCRFALPKSAVGNATYNSRSMLLAGPAPADTDFVKVSYWQGQGIFGNLVCDTAGDGADLGIQNDLEVEGDIFVDSIKESTSGSGITFANSVYLTDQAAAGADTAGQGQLWVKNITPDSLYFTTDAGDDVQLTDDKYIHATPQDFVDGSFREHFDGTVTSNGTTITFSLEQTGGGDLTMQFSDGYTILDCTDPVQTIALTAGSDSSPQKNYIYVPKSTKVLTKSTSAWPNGEHIRVAFLFVQSAAATQTAAGAMMNQNWNDHQVPEGDENGDHTHISEKLRLLHASYFDGLDGNGSTGYLTNTSGNTEFISTSGRVYQKHLQTFPAFNTSSGDMMHVKNWSGDAYHALTNLFDITADSTGSTIGNNKYFNLTFWGVQNKDGEHQTIFINLPSGFYNTQSAAENDVSGHDDYSLPREFNIDSSTGFLIVRITIRMGATWTWVSETELRGNQPTDARGSASGVATEFADNTFNIFDNTDNTKVVAFDVGGSVSTGTTRTLIIPDANGTIITTGNLSGVDHGSISGLTDDDHTQYLLADGSRALAGAWSMGNQILTNVNIDTGNIATAVVNTEWDAAFTHVSSDGTDHGHIDQAVTIAATPTFGGIVIANNGTVGQAAGPLIVFDDTNNFLEITGCDIHIGGTSPTDKLDVAGAIRLTANVAFDAGKPGRIYKAAVHGIIYQGVAGTTNNFAFVTPAGALLFYNPISSNILNFNATSGSAGFGLGAGSPAGQVHIRQPNASGTPIPVCVMEQLDIDDTFVNFIGTSAADGSRSISSDTTENSAKFGAVRVEINGTTKWIRIYDDES